MAEIILNQKVMKYTLPKGLLNKTDITVDKSTGIMETNNRTFSKSDMAIHKASYKGANRIHKPIAILFYTDIMNGEASNWDNVIKS